MTLDEHATHLGGLLGNFQSLEFCLRMFLQKLPSARPIGIPYGTDIYSFPVGASLPESEWTNYDSLGQLIDKYNAEGAKQALPPIDRTLVEIRDALAHGRVSAASVTVNLRLLKFSRPTNGQVCITFNEALSSAWFIAQKKRVFDAIETVAKSMPP
jgi:hypothetical protein